MDILELINDHLRNEQETKHLFVSKNVSLIGCPLNAGQNLKGVELACDYLRKCGIHKVVKSMNWNIEDLGNIPIDHDLKRINQNGATNGNTNGTTNGNTNGNVNESTNENTNESTDESTNESTDDSLNDHNLILLNDCEEIYNIKNIRVIADFSKKLFNVMTKELEKKNFVLNIGGDHSIAFASIMSSLQVYPNLRVIWIDAHGDMNIPETSFSGNYHGMSLAHTLGLFRRKVLHFEWAENLTYLKPENAIMLGLRDIDVYEKIAIKKCNINYYTMFDIERDGIYSIIDNALKKVDPNSQCPIHISLDIDGVDFFYAPGTGTKARGGLTYREIHFLLKYLADTNRVVSMDIVEYNPLLDVNESHIHGDSLPISKNTKRTGKLCLELISRILGNNVV